ncbi:MAG: hypothetical protein GW893_03550 [Armatimonadetes bacterium]|nr:hypothetical protein [Armatimonadota bacterium]PIU66949.1 MAG: hypothetical protein COS85_02605 [Armatimonadetes bacterium CG07_land_8_20_14_0_80_59_28]PIX41163.1 MAG: hypothetical protein COZ56_12810 [Armatimonadetes bacterium CG_4_8_14_3_um_filter_58_9]PIY43886.1 MAG: hypothetical protein COZ05_09780 [Armatimonadetes bacterium CG_4_10_14_3_um_filter_59_10]PJB63886.1 MAG: hypothetical protein CO095_15600 [Armatimonadetes bacterium CG_4_9_14_3_um_filter_58_7]
MCWDALNNAQCAASNPSCVTNPHSDGANYAFVDGHVKWFGKTALPVGDARWLPH